MYTHRKESCTIVKKRSTRTCQDSISINFGQYKRLMRKNREMVQYITQRSTAKSREVSTLKPFPAIKQGTTCEKNLARVTEEPVTLSVCCCADAALSAWSKGVAKPFRCWENGDIIPSDLLFSMLWMRRISWVWIAMNRPARNKTYLELPNEKKWGRSQLWNAIWFHSLFKSSPCTWLIQTAFKMPLVICLMGILAATSLS